MSNFPIYSHAVDITRIYALWTSTIFLISQVFKYYFSRVINITQFKYYEWSFGFRNFFFATIQVSKFLTLGLEKEHCIDKVTTHWSQKKRMGGSLGLKDNACCWHGGSFWITNKKRDGISKLKAHSLKWYRGYDLLLIRTYGA